MPAVKVHAVRLSKLFVRFSAMIETCAPRLRPAITSHAIGSHPLAGSENRGFEHAQPDLFQGRVTVITPNASTPEQELSRLKRFWQSLGSTVLQRCRGRSLRVRLASTPTAIASSALGGYHRSASSGYKSTTTSYLMLLQSRSVTLRLDSDPIVLVVVRL